MENIKKAIYYLQGMSKYNMEINKTVGKAEEELEYLLEVVSNRHIAINLDRNKMQKTLDYIWRFKMCTALDIQQYASTTDPRKYINLLQHAGIISDESSWWESTTGARFKVYYLAAVTKEQIDFDKCVLIKQ